MDIAYVKRAYRDVDALLELNGNILHADALVERYVPDIDTLVDEVMGDAELARQIIGTAGLMNMDHLNIALTWAMTATVHLLGADYVRRQLDTHRAEYVTAAVMATQEPGIFVSGYRRMRLSQWLGEFFAAYTVARTVRLEDEIDAPLPHSYSYLLLDGCLIGEISDRGMRAAVKRYAMDCMNLIWHGADCNHGPNPDTTHH